MKTANVRSVLANVSSQIKTHHRRREQTMQFRIRLNNQLRAYVCNTYGYETGWDAKDRCAAFQKADIKIEEIAADKSNGMVCSTVETISDALRQEAMNAGAMEDEVDKLPSQIVSWIEHPDQKGLGRLGFATIIGATGDLMNYANPGKVWRRLGLAPYTKEDVTRMGSSWKRYSGKKTKTLDIVKLSAEDWEDFGYCPKRRSLVYRVGECLIRGGTITKYKGELDERKEASFYRRRYNRAKEEFALNNPDESKMHAHLHAKLLMEKLLVKRMWIIWQMTGGNKEASFDYAWAAAPV